MAKPENVLGSPRTPRGEGLGSESRLESLPPNLLVQIICHLSHNDLTTVSQVSRTLTDGVQQANEFHFNYITPDLSRVNLQGSGRWSDPLFSGNGWVDSTPGTPPPTGSGEITPPRPPRPDFPSNTPPGRGDITPLRLDLTPNTPPQPRRLTSRGDITPRRLEFSRLRMEE